MTRDADKGRPEIGEGVIYEAIRIGRFVKVTAVDTTTMTEVSIQGPATADMAALRGLALRKLKFVLAKRSR